MGRVGAGEVWRREGTLVVARGGVIVRVVAAQGGKKGTAGGHEVPHSAQLPPRPYAIHEDIEKLPLREREGASAVFIRVSAFQSY